MIEHSEPHIVPKKTYYIVFATLMILLFVTVAMAFVPLGPFNIYVAMAIAITKAVLVVLYFMHVRYSNRLIWVAAGAGFVWLVILLAFTLADYSSRGWIKVPGK
ncbi:MAG: caa(3)-type oxidase, subunit [Chlorobi bacterium]|jgi:cytochrome c oxidase subunit 4|nr:caa(3)-type oxidase, subunit [Chlorobiota bacterium]